MKNIVTFETGKLLKGAGFPQPEITAGCFWYVTEFKGGTLEHSELCIAVDTIDRPMFRRLFRSANSIMLDSIDPVFAPTAADILMVIEVELTFFSEILGWCCRVNAFGHPHYDERYFHANPAEACAEAWLKINGK